MIARSRDSHENRLLRVALVSICAAGALLFGQPARAQRQELQTHLPAPSKAKLVFAAKLLGD